MSQNRQHTLSLPIDDVIAQVLLRKYGKPTNPAKQDQVSTYVRDLFDHLDGVVESISVSHKEIKVVWSQDLAGRSPFDLLAKMLTQGEYLEASLVLELLLTAEPENETILYNLGMAYSDLGVLDRAIRYLRRLAAGYPKNINGRVALGVALTRHGEMQAAITELEQAVQQDPDNPWAQRNLGAALAQAGQDAKAVKHLRRSTELNPSDDRAWYGLGQVLEQTGDLQEADHAYHRVLEIDEFGEIADLARKGSSRIAAHSFRSVTPNMERMDAVMYCLGALERFDNLTPDQVRQVGFEIAMLGTRGLDINDPTPKYQLRSLSGTFSGLHLVSIEYVAFKQFAPEMDIGLDLSKEYRAALSLYNRKKSANQG